MSLREFIDASLSNTYIGAVADMYALTAMLKRSLEKAELNAHQYMQVDRVIKNQLYSRDMAGYTTSHIAEDALFLPAPPWVGDYHKPGVQAGYAFEVKEFHLDYAVREVADKIKDNGLSNYDFLENLFHVRKKVVDTQYNSPYHSPHQVGNDTNPKPTKPKPH